MTSADDFLSELGANQRPLTDYLFLRIMEWQPRLKPSIKYGTLFFSGNRNVCYFSVKPNGVDVGFVYGYRLRPRPEFITSNRKQAISLFYEYSLNVDEMLLKNVLNEAVNLDLTFAASAKQ